MFDKNERKFYIVTCLTGLVHHGSRYANIESAREAAGTLAKKNHGIEFYVCAVDSSYAEKNIISTHYF